ncbi:MAG: dihydrolipoyl dehydrogenase [Gemmatimonadota bacterium]
MADQFDVIVIGSGPGGYVAAIRAAQLGLKAACVEVDKLGGVCLNIGCIPTKALLTSALLVNEMKHGESHGILVGDMKISLGPAQKRSRGVADQLSKGIGFLFKKNKVTHLQGYGRIKGKGEVEVQGSDGQTTTYQTKNIIVATGSRPRNLPNLQIDEERIWSSTGALFQTEAPGSLAVVGAGAVGMEFADVYESFGSKVTVVEALDRVLPLEDKECSDHVAKRYKKRGIEVLTGVWLEGSQRTDQGVQLTLKLPDGSQRVLEVDRVLSAVGRVPNTEDVGLDSVGVKMSEKGGFIETDEFLQTNVEGVYAIGDCTKPPLLAHKASHEGIVAAEHIAGHGHHTVDYSNIPNCTYTHPEVASVGLTEEQAREAGHEIEVGKFPWVGNGRALAMGDAEGFIKVIRDTKYSEILGAHIVGPHATELIAEFVLGRHLESTVEEMERAIHPHPTLSEAIGEGALASLGRPIHI